MTATATATPSGSHKKLDLVRPETAFYTHQVEGIRHLARINSWLLADDMGLGKTLQALTVAAIDFQMGYASKVLVVTLASCKWNWLDDIEKHTLFRAEVLDGSPAKRANQLADFKSHILIVNYEQVVAHVEDFNAMGFDIVVFDEAHAIKSHKSARTKACQALAAERFFLLTGSPLLNRPDELWSLLHRIDPGGFPKYWGFVSRYCNAPEAPVWMADLSFKPIGKIEAGDHVIGWRRVNGRRSMEVATVEEVRHRIAPEIIRVTMESGAVIRCTPDHRWLRASHGAEDDDVFGTIGPRSSDRRRIGRPLNSLSRVITPTRELPPDLQRKADWLAGMIDGEGGGSVTISQSRRVNPAVHKRISEVLDALGVDYREHDAGYDLRGGKQLFTDLLNWTDVVKREYFTKRVLQGNNRRADSVGQMNRWADKIVNVEYEGPGEVVSMQTSTGNYIAWGYASKNCVFGGYKDKQVVGVKNQAELSERLDGYMLRRRKVDVLDLPEKQHIPVFVDLSPEQKKLYVEARDELKITLPADPTPMELENALTKFLRLKQICGTTACIPGHEDKSNKLDRAMEIVEEKIGNGEPLVVFTQFRGVLAAFGNRMAAVKPTPIPFSVLSGDVPINKRQQVIQDWSDAAAADKPGVLLCMTQVAGVGLNLTAASTAIMLDKLFVPKLNEQAEDRLHRIGADKTKPVQIIEMICRNTVEQRVEVILSRKRKLFDTLIEGNDLKRAIFAEIMDDELDGEL